MLKTIADRMRGMLRVDDVAARMGGDEFIVLVTGIDAPAALRLGEHLLQDVSHPIALADGTRVSVGLSIGISIISRNNATPRPRWTRPTPPCIGPRRRAAAVAPSRSRTTPRNRKATSWRPEAGRGIGPK